MSDEVSFNWREIEPGLLRSEVGGFVLTARDDRWEATYRGYVLRGEALSILGATAWAEGAIPQLRMMAAFPNRLEEARFIVLSELRDIPSEAIDRPTTEGQEPGTLLFRVRAPATAEMVRAVLDSSPHIPLTWRCDVEEA